MCKFIFTHIVIYISYTLIRHFLQPCSLGVRSWLKWIPSTSTQRFLLVNTRNWKLLEAFWRGCLDFTERSNSLGTVGRGTCFNQIMGMGIMKYHEEVAVPKLSSWIDASIISAKGWWFLVPSTVIQRDLYESEKTTAPKDRQWKIWGIGYESMKVVPSMLGTRKVSRFYTSVFASFASGKVSLIWSNEQCLLEIKTGYA